MAPYNYIESTGTVVPDVSTLLDDVNAEYRAIFGDDFTVDPETPEGLLIAQEVAARASVVRNNANLANQINPNIASGVFLDAILALTGDTRQENTRSTVNVTITGVSGTTIAQGSVARTTAGDDFRAVVGFTIPASGSVVVAFESVEVGAIAAGANTLTQIVDGVIGWESITNTAAATLGQPQGSDAQTRRERRGRLALQGRNTPLATLSLVRAVTGVRSAEYRENNTNASDTIDGILLTAHSIIVIAQGGTDADIATAINEGKSSGSAYNGNTTVNVVDPSSGQTSAVSFSRPTEIAISVRVTINANPTLPTDPEAVVQQAVIDYANGDVEGEDGFIIGADVSGFELAGAINIALPAIKVRQVEIAPTIVSPVYQLTPIGISLTQIATVAVANISVVQLAA